MADGQLRQIAGLIRAIKRERAAKTRAEERARAAESWLAGIVGAVDFGRPYEQIVSADEYDRLRSAVIKAGLYMKRVQEANS